MSDKISALMASRVADFISCIPYLLVMSDQICRCMANFTLAFRHLKFLVDRHGHSLRLCSLTVNDLQISEAIS